jgi:hypothetical protein
VHLHLHVNRLLRHRAENRPVRVMVPRGLLVLMLGFVFFVRP